MDRRRFVATLAGGILAGPRAVDAQQAAKVHRVGFILSVSPISELVGDEPIHPGARGFVEGMHALGYIPGQNLVIEWRSAEGRPERHEEILREFVRLNVDAIVAANDPVAIEARRLTTTIPIVLAISVDPVASGLAQSLARPGGNVTGLIGSAGPEMVGKHLQLLKEVAPKVGRVVFLARKPGWEGPPGQHARSAAQALDMKVIHIDSQSGDIAHVLDVAVQQRPDALLVGSSPELFANKERIAAFAISSRLPSIQYPREFADAGGLMSYGVNIADLFRRAAGYVDRILKGAKPADLPIEQPTKFDLVINLKTAKALGLTIPPSLLLRADEVIQ
jgi:putative ABC transport system substrate-binding protein